MFQENILYRPEVRNKKRKWWHSPFKYTTIESIPLKEKVYTYLYNLNVFNGCTQGELQWSLLMKKLCGDAYSDIEEEFKRDFVEYSKFPNNH